MEACFRHKYQKCSRFFFCNSEKKKKKKKEICNSENKGPNVFIHLLYIFRYSMAETEKTKNKKKQNCEMQTHFQKKKKKSKV